MHKPSPADAGTTHQTCRARALVGSIGRRRMNGSLRCRWSRGASIAPLAVRWKRCTKQTTEHHEGGTMQQKRSDRKRQLRESMQMRVLTLEALLASQLPALKCPEIAPNSCADGHVVRCGQPVTRITEQPDESLVYTCGKCAQFYVGHRREINATDRVRIELELAWEAKGERWTA
jgi:hypothetical protein